MVDFKKLLNDAQDKRGYCHWEIPWKPIKAIRTDCFTFKSKEVDIFYRIRDVVKHEIMFKRKYQVFELKEGPTGYESFILENANLKNVFQFGWQACSGTPKVWDGLFIDGVEMKRVFQEEGLI